MSTLLEDLTDVVRVHNLGHATAKEPEGHACPAECIAAAVLAALVPSCRVCGCTDDEACFPACWWVDADLCSSCDSKGPRS